MKRIFGILLAAVLVFAMVGCNGKPEEPEVYVNGTAEITIDKIRYYNTDEVVGAKPDESIVKEIEVSSGTSPVINAYAMIENDKLVHCRINEKWYKFLAEGIR